MTDPLPETQDGAIRPAESVLTPYRDRSVLSSAVSITNAGDGLSDAMKIEPIELDMGETVYVVLECLVRPPQYDPIEKDNLRGPLKLVNRLRAGAATIIDYDLVKEQIEAQKSKVANAEREAERAKREEAGEVPLFDDDGQPRGGDPEPVGKILGGVDAVIDIAEEAEQTAEWRNLRTKELDTFAIPGLLELAGSEGYEIPGRHSMVKAELVDAIADVEESQRAEDGNADEE